jgi:type IV fimbrial biogenesis protein FimT
MNAKHSSLTSKIACAGACPGDCARALGFTMIEMLVTIAIAGILLTLAVPSFRYVTNSNRIAAEVNGLLGDLQFARAEAIKEGRTVTVCVSSNGTSCTNSTAWQTGWIVFADPTDVGVVDPGETIFRIQNTFSSTDNLLASNNVTAITFNRDGYAVGMANGTVITLHDATDTSAWTRCLAINLSGAMTTELYNGGGCT